jgi:hypothetical protein
LRERVARDAQQTEPGEGTCLDDSHGASPNQTRSGVCRAVWFAFAAMLLALPIFAHGCHRGDHDDEPAFIPIEHRASSAELPPY